MSLTEQEAKHFRDKPAVLCCRREAGAVLSPEDFEDPSLFSELESSDILKIPPNSLTIGQVLGLRLTETVNALTPITPDTVHLQESAVKERESQEIHGSVICTKRLEIFDFEVQKVVLGEEFAFSDGLLSVPPFALQASLSENIKKIDLDIIEPTGRDIHTNMVLDVIPIATKVMGELGEGTTFVFSGLTAIITGVDEAGQQMGEAGSCDGILSEKIHFGRPGAPQADDILIRINVVVKQGRGHNRHCVWDVHRAADQYIQGIRNLLRSRLPEKGKRRPVIEEIRRPGRTKVVYVKQLLGQGAMHDNLLFPHEPCGVKGAPSIMDLGDMPVYLSANQVRDGALHCLQCVTPSSKETTLFFQSDPLLKALHEEESFDFVGMVCAGSPAVNKEKKYVAKRLGELVEALGAEAAAITAQGFGNNHIDWAWCIEEMGKRGISVVGSTMAAVHCPLVTSNDYMDALVEHCHDGEGRETRIIADNLITDATARRILTMLKNKIEGIPIKPAKSAFSIQVIRQNELLINEGKYSDLRSEIPVPPQHEVTWTPFDKDLSQARIALVSAAGAHLKSDEPFQLGAQDATYRTIKGGTTTKDLTITHGGYDKSDAMRDINCMFPLDRLGELIAEGFILEEASRHFAFMGGGGNARKLAEMTAPAIAKALKSDEVDGVVLTAG